MNDFDVLLKKVKRFDVDKVLREVWRNPRVQNFIIELNTEGQSTSQLFAKGEDIFGVSLGDYSPFTIQLKVEKGQRTDHITLKDTGDFYETFTVFPLLKGFRLEAKGDKPDGESVFDNFEESRVVGLSENNLIILSVFIQPFFEMEAKIFLSI